MTPSRLRWGLLFITVGVMLLLNKTGYLDRDYWWDLLVWWPVFLIAVGIEKIFLRTKLQFISYLSPIALVLGMVYVAFNVGSGGYGRSVSSTYQWRQERDSSVGLLNAEIDHTDMDIYVSRTGVDLVSARFEQFSRKPDIDFSKSGQVASFKVTRRGKPGEGTIFGRRHLDRTWRISFSDEVPLNLICRGKGADATLNMRAIPLQELTVDNAEGEVNLTVGPESPLVKVKIAGHESVFSLDAPRECGIKVAGDKYKSYLETLGFVADEGFMKTAGFDTAGVKILLEPADDLRRFSIGYY
jgi:hypothetical protein